jgi:hypothetical protein
MTATCCRPGLSLAATMVALIIIEIAILGTLHLALVERQVADTTVELLELRLAADGSLATAMTQWPHAADTLSRYAPAIPVIDEVRDGLRREVRLSRAGAGAWFLHATATSMTDGHGRATAGMLILPPLLPPDFATPAGPLLGSAASGGFTADSILRRLTGQDSPRALDRVLVLEHGARLDQDFDGVLLARGDLAAGAGARLHGMLFATGTVTLEPDAVVRGAIVATGLLRAGGLFLPDTAAAATAIRRAGLRRPAPLPGRSRMPSF